MVRYRLQTLIRVVREALATGAGSEASFSGLDGVMSGRMVDRASGSRRVRKSVDDWRYVLDMCEEEFCRADDIDEDRDDMEFERICCEEVKLSAMPS
jgi:hypothetical protein